MYLYKNIAISKLYSYMLVSYFKSYFQANGDVFDDENTPNGLVSGWDYANEKFDMKVPERILVMGQDQHIG